ncbi:DUF2314 domain-containing protein, partial [Micromonospora sediminicola]
GRSFPAACATLYTGTPPHVRYPRPGDALRGGGPTPRASLGDIRARFLAGRLPDESQLVVKYGLPGDEGPEYVWAGVTSWEVPERIVGASASDANTDPGVRIGSPVVVEASDVVDWAVLDGTGVLEGGWTQAVLDAGERLAED